MPTTSNTYEFQKRLVCTVTLPSTGERLHDAEAALESYLDGLPFEAGAWLAAYNLGRFDDAGFAKWHDAFERAREIVRGNVPEGLNPLIRIARPRGRPKQPPKEKTPEMKKEAVKRANASRDARIEAGQVQTNLYLLASTKEKAARIAKSRGMSGLSELVESLIAGLDETAPETAEVGGRRRKSKQVTVAGP